jgi:hypothetical protein
LDESQLRQLVDATREQGLDVSRALAEALAFGVDITPEAAAAVGLQLPGPEAVESSREGIVAAIRQMQEQEDEEGAAAADAGEGADGMRSGRGSSSSSRSWGAGLTAATQRAKARRQQQQQQQVE